MLPRICWMMLALISCVYSIRNELRIIAHSHQKLKVIEKPNEEIRSDTKTQNFQFKYILFYSISIKRKKRKEKIYPIITKTRLLLVNITDTTGWLEILYVFWFSEWHIQLAYSLLFYFSGYHLVGLPQLFNLQLEDDAILGGKFY